MNQNSQNNRTQPPVLVRATCQPVTGYQKKGAADGMQEPPVLSSFCKAQVPSESGRQNDSVTGQMIGVLARTESRDEIKMTSKFSLVSRKIRCTPLVVEPIKQAKESAETCMTEQKKPNIIVGTDGCRIELPDCFVKLVDINKKNQSPEVMHCPVCGKEFKLRAQLKGHLRAHSDEKPFRCDKCKKDFKYSWNLNKHKREVCCQNTIHPPELSVPDSRLPGRFECPICSRIFTYSYNRMRHLQVKEVKDNVKQD
uniref:C2H2-type domain-containing protein n=1 Tax=Electrophorus electricus TaxID=8005 RepID=A0AAY5EIG0_ELEEL